jgi:hypothetical protein
MLFVFPEIVERLRNPVEGRIFRPPTEHLGVADYVLRCMKSCWDEDPEQRPDIRYVRVKLKEMQAGLYVSCHTAASRWIDHSSCDFSMSALVFCTDRPLILYVTGLSTWYSCECIQGYYKFMTLWDTEGFALNHRLSITHIIIY